MFRPTDSLHYQSYLLRIWQREGDSAEWLFSLEAVSGQHPRQGFSSLEELSTFIKEQINAVTQESVHDEREEEDDK